ncbi:hypothetical protein C8R43DRAFT_1138430 [Mycena crocata]|nr:hypothetical protein C8R43DRAFT_1138430 [Mycena crocata]
MTSLYHTMLPGAVLSALSALLLVSGEAILENRLESNGQRMARGLGPNPPARLYGFSRGVSPRVPPGGIASPVGKILVYNGTLDGPFLGYLTLYGAGGIFRDLSTLPPGGPLSVEQTTTYTYTAEANYNNTVEIVYAQLSPQRICPYGFVVSATNVGRLYLGPGLAKLTWLYSLVASTDARRSGVINNNCPQSDNTTPPPSYNPGPSHRGTAYGTSNAFTVNPRTGEIKVQYINPDSTKPATFPFWIHQTGSVSSTLIYTGDVAATSAGYERSPGFLDSWGAAAMKFVVQ